MKIIGGNVDAVELREKIDQEIDQMKATTYANDMMEDMTDAEVGDFLDSEDREWSQEDWDFVDWEWNDGTSWVTNREWAWSIFYKDFLEMDKSLFC